MSRSPIQPLFAAAAFALLCTSGVEAQSDKFLYSLSSTGRVSINGTALEKLPGNYKPGEQNGDVHGEQRWLDLEVDGNDRFMLRVDGSIHRNGEPYDSLPFSLTPSDTGVIPFWYRLEVYDGAVHAVRTDGMVSVDGDTSLMLPKQQGQFIYGFSSLAAVPTMSGHDLFVMRVDGAIWRVGNGGPGFQLRGDVPPEGETQPETKTDGFTSTAWLVLEYDPVSALLYAVRRDGVVMSFDPADYEAVAEPPNGTVLARLLTGQAPGNTGLPIETYPALTFDDMGRWLVLRYDGRLYRATASATPEDPLDELDELVNFTGAGAATPYVDVGVLGEEIWVLRSNGKVMEASAPAEVAFVVQGNPYGHFVTTTEAPDGTNFKNRVPDLTQYKPVVTAGEAVEIPILAYDLDLATENLDVDVDLALLAEDVPGATWDAEARVVHFPGDAPVGNHKFVVSVDDGKLKKPKLFKLKVKVQAADEDPDKNRPPVVTKIKNATGFVDQELVLPLLFTDADGDELLVTPVDKQGTDPFDLGASYDAKTGELRWTPTQEHVGKHTATLLVQEVGPEKPKTKKLVIKITVYSQLVFAPTEGEG